MASSGSRWIGRTGLRLALVFLAIAVASIGTTLFIAAATVSSDLNRLVSQQETGLVRAVALAAAGAYDNVGWAGARLSASVDLAGRSGAAAQVRSLSGKVISATPGFASFPSGHERREPVIVRGRQVGSVTVRWDDSGLGAVINTFETVRWHVRFAALAASMVIALVVSLVISRRITAPVDQMAEVARAMGAGDRNARVGKVRAVQEIRALCLAFDQMADALADEARMRRNMVAEIAHELRTPISVLQAGQEAMLDGLAEVSAANLSSLHEEVLRLGQMVDDLQLLASVEAAVLQLKPVPQDLGVIAAEAADSLADAFRAADVSLVRRLTEVQVSCDRLRMHEVAVNLLTNAIKFTPAGGSVVLETGPAPESGRLAMLRVTDTGIGIPAGDLPHVSERFFRGRRAAAQAGGSGIGLAIVDQLAKAHHGSLEIASEPGKGTQASITMPRSYAEHG